MVRKPLHFEVQPFDFVLSSTVEAELDRDALDTPDTLMQGEGTRLSFVPFGFFLKKCKFKQFRKE
jgi:hypothetical protein